MNPQAKSVMAFVLTGNVVGGHSVIAAALLARVAGTLVGAFRIRSLGSLSRNLQQIQRGERNTIKHIL